MMEQPNAATGTQEQTPHRNSDNLYTALRAAITTFGEKPNKNDLVDVLIHISIDNGVNKLNRIIGLLQPLGFDRCHIAIRVNLGCGPNPDLHGWRKDGEGVYLLHPEAESPRSIDPASVKL